MPEGLAVSGVRALFLEVLDLDAAERFYAEVLGLPVVERWPHREAIWVMAGRQTRIGLWRPQVGIAGGRGGLHVHYALGIADEDFDPAVARLRAAGYEPQVVVFDDTRGRGLYVHDPDGNAVERWTWDVAGHLDDSA
jgi:catechol 2,3-dioxygenase-like lactoylglutathione lyase family enzyme